MEKLKPFLDGLKAQKFWIFCGVTFLASVVVYYMVNSSLNAEEAKATSTIKSNVQTANQLQSAGVDVNPEADKEKGETSGTAHPNEETVKEMEVVVKDAAAATQQAWQKKFMLQSSYQIFDKTTIQLPTYDFQQFLPAEKVKFTDEEEGLMPEPVRVNYRDYIHNELPKLAEIIRSHWKPNTPKDATPKHEVIIWNKDNQEYWDSRFTTFTSEWNYQAEESNIPKTLQVLYTTEDLWLLRSILRDVIGKTVFDKGDIYANDLSVIKQIDHILIGKIAEQPDEGLPGGGGGGMSSGSGMMSSKSMGQSGGGGRNKSKASSSLDPISGRYVDNSGKDIPAKDYRSLYAKKGATDKKKTHWKIAKRVKVRIGLQMDTRELQNFLANCANATFPIEVRSLRVNKHKASKVSGKGKSQKGGSSLGGNSGGMSSDAEDRAGSLKGSGGGSSMAGGSGAASPGGGSGGMSGMSGKSGKQTAAVDDEGYTKPVEIYGFIYIYNKVDNEMFKILDDEKTKP